jgi:hypothetical protein
METFKVIEKHQVERKPINRLEVVCGSRRQASNLVQEFVDAMNNDCDIVAIREVTPKTLRGLLLFSRAVIVPYLDMLLTG